MRDRIPVILCIDVEPDSPRPNANRPDRWRGFERLYPYLCKFRPRLADMTGEAVRLNWFWRMDPQIETVYRSTQWAWAQYKLQMAEMVQAGDEHGLHPHAARWDAISNGWVNDYGNSEWVEHCIITSSQAFKSAFGKTCDSVRVGNGYFDDRVRTTLDRLGFLFDLTIEPGQKPPGAPTLPGPDYLSVETHPYRPSVEDFRKEDPYRSEGIWIVPLTAGVMSGRGLRCLRYLRRWSSVGPIQSGYVSLRLWEPPELVQPAIERTLESLARPYLAFAIRSDVLLNPWWNRNCRNNLEGLLGQAKSRRFVFCSPRDALHMLGLTR